MRLGQPHTPAYGANSSISARKRERERERERERMVLTNAQKWEKLDHTTLLMELLMELKYFK